MTFKFTRLLAVTAIALFCSVCAIAQPHLPPGYFWKKLPNGLEVVVIENAKVPLATIEIAVKNGAYTEGPEYSGLSHFFEHMFFKSNKDYPSQEKFIKRTQQLGAIWNGTTDVERVNYYFTFYKDSLKAGLQLMNAAIRYPLFREDDMTTERPVVNTTCPLTACLPFAAMLSMRTLLHWPKPFTATGPAAVKIRIKNTRCRRLRRLQKARHL
jgi:zinc protease